MPTIICFCTWHGTGGAQLNATMLTDEFAKRGFDAETLFLFDREGLTSGAARSTVLSSTPPSGGFEWLKLLWRLFLHLRARQPSAVIGFQPLANILGAIGATVIPRARFVGTQRNPADSQSRHTRALEKALGATRLYANNIAVSASVKSSYSRYPKPYLEKLQVVLNGTPPLPEVQDTADECRARFGMPHGRPIIGFLGRLHHQKNPEFLLEVAERLPKALFYLAGEGERQEELEVAIKQKGLSSRFILLGRVSGSDITRFYKAVDLLAFPSRYEGFGRVLVEALSQGTPVIANDIPVTREVAGEAALLLPLDADVWAANASNVLEDLSLKSSLSAAGRARAALFSVDAMADQYLVAAGIQRSLPSMALSAVLEDA